VSSLVRLAVAAAATPTPAPVHTSTGTTAVQVWTLIVAGLAVIATVVAAILLRKTGKGTVMAAERAATASADSAKAAAKSAQAAQDSVDVNRETAAGVASRADAEALSKRYQDAANQLGHAKAAVRLAGVYAMSRLADDWPEQRAVCVDLMCAYLRMPWTAASSDPEEPGEVEVRRSIVSVIRTHLQPGDDNRNWRQLKFDFTGAKLRDVDLSGSVFGWPVSFAGAVFEGTCYLYEVSFLHGADLSGSTVNGRLKVSAVVTSTIDLSNTTVASGAWLDVDTLTIAPAQGLDLDRLHVSGRLELKYAASSTPRALSGSTSCGSTMRLP
jgi:hypothetical protein